MTSPRQAERGREEQSQVEQRASHIRRQVLEALGTPPGWYAVSVRPLWDSYFRVNVLVGESVTCFTIRHSFFLLTDAAGKVLQASPEMVKRYPNMEGEVV